MALDALDGFGAAVEVAVTEDNVRGGVIPCVVKPSVLASLTGGACPHSVHARVCGRLRSKPGAAFAVVL